MSESMVRVEGLKKYFSTARGLLHAVDDVTMDIEKGHTVGIVGESGCGKSTLGRTIIHLLDYIPGSILINRPEEIHQGYCKRTSQSIGKIL